MKKLPFLFLLATVVTAGCKKDEADQLRPEIVYHSETSYPLNCDTLWIGETFTFSTVFTDNQELGSYSIEIHENFDHHSHSTESEACNLSPEKEPVNPFFYLQDFPIPEGQTLYEVSKEISLQDGNEEGPFDEGDYDLSIRLTDREGWATQTIVSIKIMRR